MSDPETHSSAKRVLLDEFEDSIAEAEHLCVTFFGAAPPPPGFDACRSLELFTEARAVMMEAAQAEGLGDESVAQLMNVAECLDSVIRGIEAYIELIAKGYEDFNPDDPN